MIDRDRWRVLGPLLDHALSLPDHSRAAWLGELRVRAPADAADLAELLGSETVADERGFLIPTTEVIPRPITVGDYHLDRPIGEGGTSSVWLAHRSDDATHPVAIKLLDFALQGSAAEERFRREGNVLARLDHQGIAQFLGAGVSTAGQPYLVLEFVEGRPIDEFARQRALSVTDRVRLVRQASAAVGHAHSNHVVHRDLKPSNILVTPEGTVKLLDFGIAKLLDHAGVGKRTELTDRGGRPFTPDFTAPEQVLGGAITAATDVYALGVLLYLLVADRHPTAANARDVGEALRALVEVQPVPPGLGQLDLILHWALRKAPDARYQTVAAFDADLDRWLRRERPSGP